MGGGDIAFADVVHQTIYFSQSVPHEKVVLDLVDTRWFQRLRDIAQTGNARLVYMFSEHSRFGHSLGVAYLANCLMNLLHRAIPSEIAPYRVAVNAAALLHDIGHIAPGSHTAYKTWYPDIRDCHEEIAIRVIKEDEEILSILSKIDPNLPNLVASILSESDSVPPWTWEVLSGGGWNVDRGNWCIVDSVMAGVSYGRYNIPALMESMTITPDGHLALRENRLDAILHFAIARHSMYRQVYHHRVLLSSEALNKAIVKRARALRGKLNFCDSHADAVLASHTPMEVAIEDLFAMRESWWWYHVMRWSESTDKTLSDLCSRLLNRRLFKTVRIREGEDRETLERDAKKAVEASGYDPEYYLFSISTEDIHSGDSRQNIRVVMDDGSIKSLSDLDPLWDTLTKESNLVRKSWLVMPEEAKTRLGRER
ncbi:MAG: HD domain-containing protein [Candidatus Dadabacteria bacterium]|nr:MAG: HD domain-containing protein [Candidatus Dadabacteria bacterium]